MKIKGDRNTINDMVKSAEFIGEHTILGEKEPGTVDLSVSPADYSDDIRERLFEMFAKADMPILSFSKKEVKLEDVFVSVTANAQETDEVEEEPEKPSFSERLKNLFVKKTQDDAEESAEERKTPEELAENTEKEEEI